MIAVLAAAVLVLAGCGDEPGEPTAPQGTGGQPTAGGAEGGEPTADIGEPTTGQVEAPKVVNPITGWEKFKADPCSMLTNAQASELGFAHKIVQPADQQAEGPLCQWTSAERGSRISLALASNLPRGLADLYRAPDQFAYFEPAEINGHPGVFAGKVDSRDRGHCVLRIGVTDEQVLHLDSGQNLETTYYDRSCEIIQQAAAAALSTMAKG